MGVELKPCPFCGGTAHVEQPGTRRQSCVVECDSCGIRHESGDEGEHCGKSWNRRDGDRAIEAVAIERCAKFMESRADEIAVAGNYTANMMAMIYRDEAKSLRALLPKEE